VVTTAADGHPLTWANSPLTGLARRGPKPSIPKEVARPGDLTSPGGRTEGRAGPCRVMGRDAASQEALCPRLIVTTRWSAWATTSPEEA
jgi:hypothetical protein